MIAKEQVLNICKRIDDGKATEEEVCALRDLALTTLSRREWERGMEDAAIQLEKRAAAIKVVSTTPDGYWHSSNYSDQHDLLMREIAAIRAALAQGEK